MPGLLEGMASNKFWLIAFDTFWVYMLAGLPPSPPGVDSASGPDQELPFYRWFAIKPLHSFDPIFFRKQPIPLPRPHTFSPNSQHHLFNRKGEDGTQQAAAAEVVEAENSINGETMVEVLVCNLHRSIFKELQGLLWDDIEDEGSNGETPDGKAATFQSDQAIHRRGKTLW